MMRRRLLELAARRTHLAALAQAERAALSVQLEPSDALAGLIDFAHRGIDLAARYPWLAGLAATALALLKPRRAVRWFVRGWSVWRVFQALRRRSPAAVAA